MVNGVGGKGWSLVLGYITSNSLGPPKRQYVIRDITKAMTRKCNE